MEATALLWFKPWVGEEGETREESICNGERKEESVGGGEGEGASLSLVTLLFYYFQITTNKY